MNGPVTRGEFREVAPNDRLVYTFGWEGEATSVPPGSTVVTIVLTPRDNGTSVTLVHSGLPVAALEGHKKGWLHYCGRLSQAAAGRDPGPDAGPA